MEVAQRTTRSLGKKLLVRRVDMASAFAPLGFPGVYFPGGNVLRSEQGRAWSTHCHEPKLTPEPYGEMQCTTITS
jgi:hypothetical protein